MAGNDVKSLASSIQNGRKLLCIIVKGEQGNLENNERHSPYNCSEMEKAKWIEEYMKYFI